MEPQETELIVALNEEQLLRELLPEIEIGAVRSKYLSVTIQDWRDRDTIDLATQGRRLALQGLRSIEDQRVTLKAPALAYGRAVDRQADALKAGLREVVDHLDPQLKRAKAEKEAAKEAAERAAREALQAKFMALHELGSPIPLADVEAMSAEDYERALALAEIQHAETLEATRLAEEAAAAARIAEAQALAEERARAQAEMYKRVAEANEARRQAADAKAAADEARRELESMRAAERVRLERERAAEEAQIAALKASLGASDEPQDERGPSDDPGAVSEPELAGMPISASDDVVFQAWWGDSYLPALEDLSETLFACPVRIPEAVQQAIQTLRAFA